MPANESLRPRDHAEAIALFRAQIIGALARRDFAHGELAAALRALAAERYRPPGSSTARPISVSTLERWLYAYRRGGLAALRPEARSDRGRGRELTPAQRELLLDIRREHPTASVPLILRTLVADGRLDADGVSATTVARLYRDAGLERGARFDGHTRLRWQADHAGALWHGDVCHGPTLRIGATTRPLRIHALLDDASRFVLALEAHHTEREADMTSLHDVQVRLGAFLDEHYHHAPHGGLLGKTPAEAWASASCRAVDEPALAAALTVHRRRRVRKDGTVDLDGRVWQLDQGFLAGRVVTVVAAHAGLAGDPVALHDGHRYAMRAADPVAASRTRRRRRAEAPPSTTPFDPAGALLDKTAGRPPRHRKEKP